MKTGFDFMCNGEQHHTYHMGCLINGYVDQMFLDSSCNFPSRIKSDLKVSPVTYGNKFKLILEVCKSKIRKDQISIIGIKSEFLFLFIPLSLFGRKIEVHLHGQLAGIQNSKKYFIWKVYSKFFKLVVGNPIYQGPDFIKSIGNVGSFAFLEKDIMNLNSQKKCLLYGANKDFLTDKGVHSRLEGAGYKVTALVSENGYVPLNQIVTAAESATHTFVTLKKSHYLLSPSGRVCDLNIYKLNPLVFSEDIETQEVLDLYGMSYEVVP